MQPPPPPPPQPTQPGPHPREPKQLSQQQILQLLQSLISAKTQLQINALQAEIKTNLIHEKNVAKLVNIMIEKRSQDVGGVKRDDLRVVGVFVLKLVVQQFLRQYNQVKAHSDRYKPKVHELIRKDIINLCSKIQKIIDSNVVSIQIKPDLVFLQLKLYGRSKQQWDSSRLSNKMQYYFRKQQPIIGQAYFRYLYKLGFTAKEKIQLIRKGANHLPLNAVKAFTRILKGQGNSNSPYKSGGYADFICSFQALLNILNDMYFEQSKQIVKVLANTQPFMTLLKIVAKQIQENQATHPATEIEKWRETLIQIFKKMAEFIGHHQLGSQCCNFLEIFLQYVNHIFENKYKPNLMTPNKYQPLFGQYLPLFITCTRHKILPPTFLTPPNPNPLTPPPPTLLPQILQPHPSLLTPTQKLYIFQVYIMPLYLHITHRLEQFLLSTRKEEQDQFIQFFGEFCSAEEVDYGAEEFGYNFGVFFGGVVEGYKAVGVFLKSFVAGLLMCDDPDQEVYELSMESNNSNINNTNNNSKNNVDLDISKLWIKEQIQMIKKLPSSYNGNFNYKQQIGMLLSIILYKHFSKDQQFLTTHLQTFITHTLTPKPPIQALTNLSLHQPSPTKISTPEGLQKLKQSPSTLTIFLLFFQNYMEDISMFEKKPYVRIEGDGWKYVGFVREVVGEIAGVEVRGEVGGKMGGKGLLDNVGLLYLSFLIKYTKLVKQIIQTLKLQSIYSSNIPYKLFPQLQTPLQPFHHLHKHLHPKFHSALYRQIIEYSTFKSQSESPQQTLDRVRSILTTMISHQSEESQNAIYYQHEIFVIFGVVSLCEEYGVLLKDILLWVVQMCAKDGWYSEFEEDIVGLCVGVLRKSGLMAGFDQATLLALWQLIYLVASKYQWQQYDIQSQNQQNQSSSYTIPLECFSNPQSAQYDPPLRIKVLLLFYLSLQHQIPPQLLQCLTETTTKTLQTLTETLHSKTHNLQTTKIRPYQHQQIQHLLILHKIIINHGTREQFTLQTIVQVLQLYSQNYTYRNQYPEEFNYVNGKYSLCVVLMVRYCYGKMWEGLGMLVARNGLDAETFVGNMFYDVFYNQLYYRISYDIPLYVRSVVDIVSYLWSDKYTTQQLKYILKYSHFIIGSCIICLDRIHQNHRYNKQQQLQIPIFKQILQQPILTMNLQFDHLINYMTGHQPYFDQFAYFHRLYRKLTGNGVTNAWFLDSMDLYVKTQVYMEHHLHVFDVRKVRKGNGDVVYRVWRRIKGQGGLEVEGQ